MEKFVATISQCQEICDGIMEAMKGKGSEIQQIIASHQFQLTNSPPTNPCNRFNELQYALIVVPPLRKAAEERFADSLYRLVVEAIDAQGITGDEASAEISRVIHSVEADLSSFLEIAESLIADSNSYKASAATQSRKAASSQRSSSGGSSDRDVARLVESLSAIQREFVKYLVKTDDEHSNQVGSGSGPASSSSVLSVSVTRASIITGSVDQLGSPSMTATDVSSLATDAAEDDDNTMEDGDVQLQGEDGETVRYG